MTSIEGHGNVSNNAFGKKSRTRIVNKIKVGSTGGLPPIPPGQVTIENDRNLGPNAWWFLAAAIVTVSGGVFSGWKTVSEFFAGLGRPSSGTGIALLPVPTAWPWMLAFLVLCLIALGSLILFRRARDEGIPISTGRFTQHRHLGGSDSHHLRLVRTQAICPRCKKKRTLRFVRIPVQFNEHSNADGSVERIPTKWEFLALCSRNSSHKWSIDEDVVSRLVDGYS